MRGTSEMVSDSAMRPCGSDEGTGVGASGRLARAIAAAAVTAMVAVAALAAWHVWFNYSLMAWSDPLNWLRFARNLGTEFSTSMFPVGYPLFLRAALDVLGPYLVFFANFPLIVLYSLLGAAIVGRALSERRHAASVLPAQALAFACLIACDPEMVRLLTNPYRDPLSYVYLFGSILMLLDYLSGKPRRMWRLAGSGLLFGAAYSVREPSLLMAGPMGLMVLTCWFRDRDIPLLKGGAVFVSAAILGGAPLIVQSLVSHGGLLPPQISNGDIQATSGINPGDMALFRANAGLMGTVIGDLLVRLTVLFALGAGYALADRNRTMLTIIIPGTAMYGVMYLFYNTFVHRYYYVVLLMAAIVASYGLCRLTLDVGRAFERMLGARRAAVFVAPAASLVLIALGIAYAAVQFVPKGPRHSAFRLAQAREFAATVEKNIPVADRPVVICRRNLCELIEWFGRIDSCDTPFFVNAAPADRLPALKSHVESILAAGRPVYFIDFPRGETEARDSGPLSQLFDLYYIKDIRLDHCVPAEWGMGSVPLFSVRPATNTHADISVPRSLSNGGWLEVRAGLLWRAGDGRSNAVIRVGNAVVTDRLPDGFSVLPLEASKGTSEATVTFESDKPFAAESPLRVRSFADVLSYDFNYYATPFAANLSGEGLLHPDPKYRLYPAIFSNALVVLTAPLPSRGLSRIMEVKVQAAMCDDLPDDLMEILIGGVAVGGIPVPRNGSETETEVVLDSSSGERFTLELRRRHGGKRGPARMKRRSDIPDAVFLQAVRFAYVDPVPTSGVFRVGSVGDSLAMRGGFWSQERFAGGVAGRWTTGSARLCLRTAEPRGDGRLVLVANTTFRPPAANPVDLKVVLNGHTLALGAGTVDAATHAQSFEAPVPHAWLSASNDVEIVCNPWRPADYGSADTRDLGVVVHGLALDVGETGRR